MRIKIGEIAALFRYPVKSMGGESLVTADLGWHGIDGDRRLALRRIEDRSGFPWLSASKLPELIRFTPLRRGPGDLPTHVRTPEGEELELFGSDLAAEVSRRFGSPVEMVHLNRGIFDEASISVISATTVDEIGRLSAQPAEVRRFRPNILIRSSRSTPFEEDDWVGGVLTFGEEPDVCAVHVTNFDERCVMVNLDPETAASSPAVLKAIVGARNNKAGVYAAVTRRGRLSVGQPIFFQSSGEQRA